jgi:acetyl-CoA acetyltransferase
VSRAVILSAVRTPIGRYGGALAGVRPDDLAALVISAAVERAGVPSEQIEDVFLGCANQAVRTTGTSPGWRCCSPGCRNQFRASP